MEEDINLNFTIEELKQLYISFTDQITVLYNKTPEARISLANKHPYWSAIYKIAENYHKIVFGYTE